MSIIEKLNIDIGQYVVRKRTDESFDSPFVEYSVNAFFPWGEQNLACGINNPNTARLFATAPQMLEAMVNAMSILDAVEYGDTDLTVPLKYAIKKATGKTWAEIKELI